MENNNSNLSISIDGQNDNIKYSIESVPEILPQYVVNDNNLDNRSVIEFNPKDLPNIIAEQGKTLNEFCEKKKQAIIQAAAAKKQADEANKKKVGWFTGKKVAIEELQCATVSISEALDSLAEAVNQSYINQEKIAKVNEYLLGLGLTNTTLNRMVIRELEMKLNNASPEELSELAKQELMSVLRQLKAQEDIQNRLEKQAEGLRSHEQKIEDAFKDIEEQKIDIISIKNDIYKSINEATEQIEQLKNDIRQQNEKIIETKADLVKLQCSIQQIIEEKDNSIATLITEVKQFQKKGFFDSALYKFILAIVAISALIIAIIN